MKLKKFAAMMLAGVMAVSMLAGCSGKGTNGGNGDDGVVVEPSSSSIVTAFNNGQDEDNDVKVAFTSDSKLDTVLAKAAESADEYASDAWIGAKMKLLSGIFSYVEDTELWDDDDRANLKVGQSQTALIVKQYTSSAYWTEADAVNAAAREVDKLIATLDVGKREGNETDKYKTFSYDGSVSMVSVERNSGKTVYFVAYTITQTVGEGTVTAA